VTYPAPDDGLKPAPVWTLLLALVGYAAIGFAVGMAVVALVKALL
jgi:hypothetical protein